MIDVEKVIAEARKHSLTRDNPLLADLPPFFHSYRDHQRVAVREILTAYEEGAECVVLDAPTGSGKTLIGETVRRLVCGSQRPLSVASSSAATYICSSKALQDQFLRDYPYAKVLKGRSNYPTESYPERWTGDRDSLSCADCTKSPGEPESCMWCVSTAVCPYERAKWQALQSSLAVLNTSYFLSECNGPGRFSRGGFVIADEADTLESELMSHVEVRISERRLKQYGLGVPRFVTKEESWREWAEEAYEKIRSSPPRSQNSSELEAVRASKRHTALVDKVRFLRQGLSTGDWIYTGDRNTVAFKPVSVSNLGPDKLWQHGNKWLLMSATVISADELLESLGWDEEKEWRLVKCPSTFKPENRKVIVWPCADMTWKKKETEYPKMVAGVKQVVDRHPDERVLVHSTSYALTNHLVEALRVGRGLPAGASATAEIVNPVPSPRQIITYPSSILKDSRLAEWLASPNGVLVAPSMERGIDLPGDRCRVQIICKVPYKSLSDKQVSARVWGGGKVGKLWYAVDAIRSIVQATGRAVRSEDDWAVTYILDSQFVSNVWSNHKRLIPEWWKEGIEWRMKGI